MIRHLINTTMLAAAVCLVPALAIGQQTAPPKKASSSGSPSDANKAPPQGDTFEKAGLKKADTQEKTAADTKAAVAKEKGR